MKQKNINRSEKGQTLVIMLLIMVVGLTVGLYLMGRTTTDISLTTKVTDSSRAFNVAEAGIEEAIKNPNASPGTLTTGTYTPQVANLGGSTGIYPLKKQPATKMGEAFTVWLVGHDAAGNLDGSIHFDGNNIDVCFDGVSPNIPNIAITLYYRICSAPGPYSYRSSYAFFISSSAVVGGPCSGYERSINVNLNRNNSNSFGNLGYPPPPPNFTNPLYLALRIRPIKYDTAIAVNGGNTEPLPKQGTDINSTGQSGETTRKINVKNPYLVPPAFMDYVIYSNSNIVK